MANPLDGFTGSPSFLLAYATDATATDGIKAPADYTNAGVKQAQAISVSIANLLDTGKTADGSLSAPDASGYYTATLLGTGTKKFPVGATMRAVGLQGYFTQVSPAAARHAISVVKEVTGDAVRRKVVDADKCANCHEWFEGHGGNRVYQTQVCVMCHVPGLATSGRQIPDSTMNTWTFSAELQKIVDFWKFDKTKANAALALPVTTNNFKDMIHGIHAGRDRVNPFRDARDSTSRGEVTLLDFARMDFPGQLNNCETCHVSGTYSSVPLNALPSTYETIDAAYDAAIAGGTATTVNGQERSCRRPAANGTDHVTTPFAGACVSCHDSTATQVAHQAARWPDAGQPQYHRSGGQRILRDLPRSRPQRGSGDRSQVERRTGHGTPCPVDLACWPLVLASHLKAPHYRQIAAGSRLFAEGESGGFCCRTLSALTAHWQLPEHQYTSFREHKEPPFPPAESLWIHWQRPLKRTEAGSLSLPAYLHRS